MLMCNSCGKLKSDSEFRYNPNAKWRRCHECAKTNRLKGTIYKKLTDEDKEMIRKEYGELNGKQLAKKYGVTDTTIYRILDTGYTKEIRERNQKVREAFAKGIKTVEELAKEHGMSKIWVKKVIKLYK